MKAVAQSILPLVWNAICNCAQSRTCRCASRPRRRRFTICCVAALRGMRRPLVVMSPKSLLRHPLAISSLDELANGTFLPAIGEIDDRSESGQARRAVLRQGLL